MSEHNISESPLQKSKTHGVILVVLFSLMLLLPMFFFFFSKNITVLENEQRLVAQKPILNTDSIINYPKQYEKYFNDQFPFRQSLLALNSYYKAKCLGVSPLPDKVIIGKNNWLFYTSCISDTFQMQDFAGEIPYSATILERIRKNMIEEKKYLDSLHIPLIIIVVPNKQDIYPEYLPDAYVMHRGKSRLDQIDDEVKDLSCFIDLREELKKAKAKYSGIPLYYKTDTHWNQLGALIAWEQILKKISPEKGQNEFKIHYSKDTLKGNDLAHMIGIPKSYEDDFIYNVPLDIKHKFQKAIVFHDSFYGMMEPYLKNSCDSIIQTEHWAGINCRLVEKEKPDFVLLEISERYTSVLERSKY